MVDSRNEMPDLSDYELAHAPDNPPLPRPGRSLGLWLVVAGLVAIIAIAAYIAFSGDGVQPPYS